MFSNKTEEAIKTDMLSKIINTIDKTENSLVHDALSPAALEIANAYMALEFLDKKRDAENLFDYDLDIFVSQRTNIIRKRATHSVATVKIAGNQGTAINAGETVQAGDIRFFVVNDAAIDPNGEAIIDVECEQAGAVGNVPAGAINEFTENKQGIALVTNLEPAEGGYDAESDNDLRFRYYEKIRTPATSGNTYHYRDWAKEVTGVGEALVTPRWQGNGTVKVTFVDANKEVPSVELIEEVRAHIEENRPIGATVTVVGGKEKLIHITGSVSISTDTTIQNVVTAFKEKLKDYGNDMTFGAGYISLAKIGNLLFEINGVTDYVNLKMNNSIANITLLEDEVPKFTVNIGMVV